MAPELIIQSVEDHMSQRWIWGASDCCSSARNVFHDLHGVDFMADIEEYDSAAEAVRLIKSYGGFVDIVEYAMASAGLRDGVGNPGEVGISYQGAAEGIEGYALLICIEPGKWAGKTEYGYAILPDAERSWRV